MSTPSGRRRNCDRAPHLPGNDVVARAQCGIVDRLFRRAIAAGEVLHVPVTVAMELEWVLRSTYGFTRLEIIETFYRLIWSAELDFDAEATLERALVARAESGADFSDCLHAALAAARGRRLSSLSTVPPRSSKLRGGWAAEYFGNLSPLPAVPRVFSLRSRPPPRAPTPTRESGPARSTRQAPAPHPAPPRSTTRSRATVSRCRPGRRAPAPPATRRSSFPRTPTAPGCPRCCRDRCCG